MADAERSTRLHTAHLVDGNAVVGALEELLGDDLSTLTVECGGCHDSAPLAEWRVEADRHAFIVRCPSCTHTVWTLLRGGAGPELRVAGPCVIRRVTAGNDSPEQTPTR